MIPRAPLGTCEGMPVSPSPDRASSAWRPCVHLTAFCGFVSSPSWLHKDPRCHSLWWSSVSLMNGSVPQFPDEKGEGQREQGACLQSGVGLWELGWALGSAGWVHILSVPFLQVLALCSYTFCQRNAEGTSTPHPHLTALSGSGKSASF